MRTADAAAVLINLLRSGDLDTADLHEFERLVRSAVVVLNRDEDTRFVDLAYCIGAECIRQNGLRLATWRGRRSMLVCCDECYSTRLDADEQAEMVEVVGADVVRRLGLHALVNGRELSGSEGSRGRTSPSEPSSPR